MGLDMYLYKATKEDKAELKKLCKEERKINRKQDTIEKKMSFPSWDGISTYAEYDRLLTDEQRAAMEEYREECRAIDRKIRVIRDRMNPADMDKDYNLGYCHYWRKANAIHAYFVDKFANGKDECQDIAVSKSKFKKFIADLEDTKKVLDESKRFYFDADNKLLESEEGSSYYRIDCDVEKLKVAPRGGFFFGPTEIGDWYYTDITETLDYFKEFLEEWKKGEVVWYSASW